MGKEPEFNDGRILVSERNLVFTTPVVGAIVVGALAMAASLWGLIGSIDGARKEAASSREEVKKLADATTSEVAKVAAATAAEVAKVAAEVNKDRWKRAHQREFVYELGKRNPQLNIPDSDDVIKKVDGN